MKDAMSGYCELTGNSPMLPKSAFGFWMSKERYKTFDELQDVVRTYRMRNIPLDNIVQDWQYWGCNENWNSMKFQNPRYINKMGDPEYMKFLPNGEDRNANYGTPRIKSPKEMIDYEHKQNAQSRSKTLRPVQSDSTRYVLGRNEKEHLRSRYGWLVARLYRAGSSGNQGQRFRHPHLSRFIPQSAQRFPFDVQQGCIRTSTCYHFRQAGIPAHTFVFPRTATLCVTFMER